MNMSQSTQKILSEENKSKFLSLKRIVRKKEEFDHLKENPALTVLVKLPKKLEDLAELNKVKKEFELTSRINNRETQLTLLSKLTQTVNSKYFLSCLLKSVASVNSTNYRQKSQSLNGLWNELTDADFPNRHDILFGLLWYKLNSAQVNEEGSEGLKERLEGLINLNQRCANFLVGLQGSQTSQTRAYTAMSSELVRAVEERQGFLAERLLERGQFFRSFNSIFLDEATLEDLKSKHYLANLRTLVDAVKNLLYAIVNEHNPSLLEELAGWLKGKVALHPLFNRLNGLISLFKASKAKSLQTLQTDCSRLKLNAEVVEMLGARLGDIKYQRLKTMVEDTDLLKKFTL